MTKRQREALKLAMECMKIVMRPLAFDANVAMLDPNAPPIMQKRLKKYRELTAAMIVIEYMVRGVQTEMEI